MEKVTSTSPMVKDGKKLTRRFLGNIFPKTGIEKNEYKAYLKGHSTYQYKGTGEVVIAIDKLGQLVYGFKVRQEYFYV